MADVAGDHRGDCISYPSRVREHQTTLAGQDMRQHLDARKMIELISEQPAFVILAGAVTDLR